MVQQPVPDQRNRVLRVREFRQKLTNPDQPGRPNPPPPASPSPTSCTLASRRPFHLPRIHRNVELPAFRVQNRRNLPYRPGTLVCRRKRSSAVENTGQCEPIPASIAASSSSLNSVILAATTSSVSTAATRTGLARCITLAIVTAILKPVNEPGPIDRCICSIPLACLPKRPNSPSIAGNISAPCIIGPENRRSASRSGPSASPTEPIRLDVSSTSISGRDTASPADLPGFFPASIISVLKTGLSRRPFSVPRAYFFVEQPGRTRYYRLNG